IISLNEKARIRNYLAFGVAVMSCGFKIERTKPCGIQNSVLELNQSNFLGADQKPPHFFGQFTS
ncbi:hypothetical protein Q7345_09970, partial [Glaesserella parasuis]|nr:hypothetical protein [Glaesserella parasuis]